MYFFSLKIKKITLNPSIFQKDAYTRKDQPNICFIWYEEMKADLDAVIDKVNTFLELPPITIENKKALKDFLHIDNFRYGSCASVLETISQLKTRPLIG